MATDVDTKTLVSDIVDEHNKVVKSREFGPFVMRLYDLPGCKLSFTHDAAGLDRAMLMWKHLLPAGTGEKAPRKVTQTPYKVEDNRVFTYRAVQGGGASRPGDPTQGGGPRTLWGWQETQFDDRSLISEMIILSAEDEPQVEINEEQVKSRTGRIFSQFVDVFNEYFRTGNADLLAPWCSDDIHMAINDTFYGMAVSAPFNRIPPTVDFELRDVKEVDGRVHVDLFITNWGGLDMGCRWDLLLSPEGKMREQLITVDV
jgi:hypothetical protein